MHAAQGLPMPPQGHEGRQMKRKAKAVRRPSSEERKEEAKRLQAERDYNAQMEHSLRGCAVT
jgi:hypothetical protein